MNEGIPNLNSKHTQGPFFYTRDAEGVDDVWQIRAKSDESILATIHFWHEPDYPEEARETEANARLFAAAPDLLEALKEFLAWASTLPTANLDADFYKIEEQAWLLVSRIEGSG